MRGKIVRIIRACELSESILHYIFINDPNLCPGQPCELSGVYELARVKLSGLYCTEGFVGLEVRELSLPGKCFIDIY